MSSQSKIKWVNPAVPRSVIQMVPCDVNGMVLVMHRSANVRSIPNVWSFPSGMHDIGETQEACLARELKEEYDLDALDAALVTMYENIAGDAPDREQYHWVIALYVVVVQDVTRAVNREPDKHDKMATLHYTLLADDRFWQEHRFHSSFEDIMHDGRHRLALTVQALVQKNMELQCSQLLESTSSPAASPEA